jgi:hypothetical protein
MTMKLQSSRRFIIPILVLLALWLSSVGLVKAAPTCPTADHPIGCAVITLNSATLTGDYYVADALVAQQQNPAAISVEPGQAVTVGIRNVQDTSAGFGSLFIYEDTTKAVQVSSGQTKPYTVTPRKVFIRGTFAVTCDIQSAKAADDIACQVVIDNVPQAVKLLAGQSASYILDPGAHSLRLLLVGALAGLWDPANRDTTATIIAGKTVTFKPRFEKKAHLTIALSQPGVAADLFVDGALIASQVASDDLWVAPRVAHVIEAKNASDPAANGVYKWRDASTRSTLNPAQERTVTVTLVKQYLKGFLKLKCAVQGLPAGTSAACIPSLNGVALESIPVGKTIQYTLDPGSQTLIVTLQSDRWRAEPATVQVTITAGGTTNRTVTLKAVPLSYPIYMGNSLSPGLDLGVDTSGRRHDWLTNMSGFMRMAYPSAQEWGAIFITVGPVTPAPHPSIDLSAFDTLSLDLRGDFGNETVYIGIKDWLDPDDGTEVTVPIQVTSGWKTYTFDLSTFFTADLKHVYIPTEFVFKGPSAETVYFRNVQYLDLH